MMMQYKMPSSFFKSHRNSSHALILFDDDQKVFQVQYVHPIVFKHNPIIILIRDIGILSSSLKSPDY